MRVIIVGGGWSGLAAATALSRHPCKVSLFEAGGILGGRARSVHWQDINVDNGQHLMLGAYQQMLTLMQQIGLDADQVFSRQALDLTMLDPRYKPIQINSRGLFPAAVNRFYYLFKSGGLSSIMAIRRLQAQLPEVTSDMTVAALLQQTRQPQRLIDQLWEPLTLAMLNTPLQQASARVLADVLNASLFAGEQATELLIPNRPLTEVLPAPAARYLLQHGADIQLNNRIQSLIINNDKITGIVDQHGQPHFADTVVLALPPAALARLLPDNTSIPAPDEYPICTVYLQYQATVSASQPMTGFSGTTTQWLFDRCFQKPGLMAVVISGPGAHMQLSKAELASKVSQELAELLPDWPEQAESALVIREKHATFACTPATQQARPDCRTIIKNLWLAGDFVRHPFPATLETAISIGLQCAEEILQSAP